MSRASLIVTEWFLHLTPSGASAATVSATSAAVTCSGCPRSARPLRTPAGGYERVCGNGAAGAELRDDASLVVTELFTNAVRHTDSEKITCVLHDCGSVVRVEVTDQGRGTGVAGARGSRC